MMIHISMNTMITLDDFTFAQLRLDRDFNEKLGHLLRDISFAAKVTLFPNLNGFEKWSSKKDELSHIASFTVSDLLERKASNAEKEQGLDLADYLIRLDYKKFALPETVLPPFQEIKPITAVHNHLLNVHSNDVLNALITTFLSKEFNRMALVTLLTNKGIIEILFNKDGDLVKQGEGDETVKLFASFFEKDFVTLIFDEIPCWGTI